MLTPELIKEIHENAVAHGWWEGERDIAEIYALIHSELSEALEEYRSGKEMIYYVDGKPEGIAVELADAVIRILDYIAQMKYPFDTTLNDLRPHNYTLPHVGQEDGTMTLPQLVAYCHHKVSGSLYLEWDVIKGYEIVKNAIIAKFKCAISLINKFLSDNGLDLYEIIRIKHEYNKTRPYRHGGKIC